VRLRNAASSLSSRRLLAVAAVPVAVIGLAACGNKKSHPTIASAGPEGSAASGFYLDAGPITYQLQVARQINPYDTEDHNYLQGVNAPLDPGANYLWFVVFLRAINQSGHPATTSGHIQIIDTQGNVYTPIPISQSANPLAYAPTLLAPGSTDPAPNSMASLDFAQGLELLFKMDQVVYSNRPLTLQIFAPGQAKASRIQLDL
jgi:hypothetical protein